MALKAGLLGAGIAIAVVLAGLAVPKDRSWFRSWIGGHAGGLPVAAPAAPPDRLDAPALPAYVMNMGGGDIDVSAQIPGDPMGPPVIADPGSRLEIAVRGELEVENRVHVKLYWRMGDQLQRWRPSGQYGPFSTFRYRGAAEAPFGKGRGDIVVIVSPFPDIPDVVHPSWLGKPPRHWQIMRQPVIWRTAGAATSPAAKDAG